MLIDKDLRLSISGCFWLFYASKYIRKKKKRYAYLVERKREKYPNCVQG